MQENYTGIRQGACCQSKSQVIYSIIDPGLNNKRINTYSTKT